LKKCSFVEYKDLENACKVVNHVELFFFIEIMPFAIAKSILFMLSFLQSGKGKGSYHEFMGYDNEECLKE